MIRRISHFFGRFSGLYLPFGLFAVIAVGIHAGSDRVDDHAFVLLNLVDAVSDDAVGAIITFVLDLLGASKTTTARATFWWADLIDLDTKRWLARATALAVELVADALLALPLFFYRRRKEPLKVQLENLKKEPTVLKVAAPSSAFLASLAGVLVIAREIQVASFAKLSAWSSSAPWAGYVASGLGALLLAVVAWRLGSRVVLSAICWADVRARADIVNLVSDRKRRLRGWGVAVLVLPVTVLAVTEATPPLEVLRALFAAG